MRSCGLTGGASGLCVSGLSVVAPLATGAGPAPPLINAVESVVFVAGAVVSPEATGASGAGPATVPGGVRATMS